MTEAHLAAIEARANVAQRGPWRPDIDGPGMVYAGALNWQDTGGNADFIAHARTDIPALVAEVRRLRALIEREMLPDKCECGTCASLRRWLNGEQEQKEGHP